MIASRFTLLCAGLLAAWGASPLFAQTPAPADQAAAVVEKALQPAVPAAEPAPFLADLTRQLSENYKVSGDLQIELVRAWATPSSASGPITVQLLEAPAVLNSNLLVKVHFQSGDKSLGETSLLLRAQLMREVWLTRTPLTRGMVFDPSQLDTRRVDALRERDTVALSDGGSDLTICRPLGAGQVLTWHDVTRRALVRKGDIIEVVAIDGTLSINMKALAMESGAAGDSVRLRNIESKREFTALVIGQSRAQIRL